MSTDLHETARELVAPSRGILAADESTGTIKKRFDSIGVESTEENRRAYRDLLFTTAGLGDHISGVILYDETIRQSSADGTAFPALLEKQGIIPGIKVDTGAKPLALHEGETVTEGLDGLRERLTDYRELGARFAKWRATITIGQALPTTYAIDANSHAMARYAAVCQEAGIVPIVEPEILMDGDHHIDACDSATARTLRSLYECMAAARVDLPGTLLKVNMVLCGKGCADQADHAQVAEATIACLAANVPAEVPGVVFLSGGQSDLDSTVHLQEMNARGPYPWALSFSYGRALQAPSLKAWQGRSENVAAAQAALAHRAEMNGLARDGRYSADLDGAAA